jgi:hypothetical protein
MPGFSDYAEGKVLDHVFSTTAYTAPTVRAIKLHTGPPGDAGTAAAAVETTRKAVTFAASASGAISSNAQVQWTAYNAGGTGATETVTHWSLWDATSAGNCLATGPLGGVAPFTASVDAANETFTAQAHGLAVGNTVEVYPLPGNTLPAGLSADTAYTVATAPTSSTFTLTGVNVTASGTCVVQRYVGKVVNDGDTVTIASGQVTIYAD